MDIGNLRAKVEESSVNGVFGLSSRPIVLMYAHQNNNAKVENNAQLDASEIVVPISKEDSNGIQCKEFYNLKLTKDGEKNSFATSASTMTTISKDLKGMNQELLLKCKESMEYLLSKPSINVTKSRREGHLPSYNFNFKCDERAHKRKEFHMKLEEKVRAKELERAIMEAKLKEFEEEQIKIIRKASSFKAKPLPSFYFERLQQKNLPSMSKPLKLGVQKTLVRNIPEGAHYTNHPPEVPTQIHTISESCRLPCKKPLQRAFPKLSPGY